MTTQVLFKDMSPHSQLQKKVQQKTLKLEAQIAKFPQDAAHLQIVIQKNSKRLWFTAALTMSLPTGTLRAEKAAPDPIPALDQATKSLVRELSVLKSSLRRKSTWKNARMFGPPASRWIAEAAG
jgi:ribosome-associated translation inhibitor RaiA